MSIMARLFGNIPNVAVQASPTGTNVPVTQTQQPGAPQTQADPNNPTAPGKDANPQPSPTDAIAKLWETPKNAPTSLSDPIIGPIDPQKLNEAINQTDFLGALPKEVQDQIRAGGDNAVSAISNIANQAARAAFARSAMSTTTIVEQALQKQAERIMQQLPSLVANVNSTNALRDIPGFDNPAIAPVLENMKARILQHNPHATPSEVTAVVKDFVKLFGNLNDGLKPKPAPSKNAKTDDVDWDDFANS